MPRARRRTRSPVVGLVVVLAVLLALTACSGTSEDAAPEGRDGRSDRSAALGTTTKIGTVVGRLEADRRKPLKRGVEKTVDRWLRQAYVGGEFPRSGGFRKAFPGFSSGAKDEARRDLRVMTNVAVADRVRRVVVRRSDLLLDVLATRGRPRAVTARVHLVFSTRGGVDRRDRVRGRLHLTWRNGGWQVFGYDITRGRA